THQRTSTRAPAQNMSVSTSGSLGSGIQPFSRAMRSLDGSSGGKSPSRTVSGTRDKVGGGSSVSVWPAKHAAYTSRCVTPSARSAGMSAARFSSGTRTTYFFYGARLRGSGIGRNSPNLGSSAYTLVLYMHGSRAFGGVRPGAAGDSETRGGRGPPRHH